MNMCRWGLCLLLSLTVIACKTSQINTLPDDLMDGEKSGQGVVHSVKQGQTLWRIAQAYGVELQLLAELNDLDDVSKIEIGQKLWIPGVKQWIDVPPAPSLVKNQQPNTLPPIKPAPVPAVVENEKPAPKLQVNKTRFLWPLRGKLLSPFGIRDGRQHDGIDIDAAMRTPVLAADAGEVMFVGEQRGYGLLVLLLHKDGLMTVYAHTDENVVTKGMHVQRGQLIAYSGQTGRATCPHLHFEVRENRAPRNPLFFLPSFGVL